MRGAQRPRAGGLTTALPLRGALLALLCVALHIPDGASRAIRTHAMHRPPGWVWGRRRGGVNGDACCRKQRSGGSAWRQGRTTVDGTGRVGSSVPCRMRPCVAGRRTGDLPPGFGAVGEQGGAGSNGHRPCTCARAPTCGLCLLASLELMWASLPPHHAAESVLLRVETSHHTQTVSRDLAASCTGAQSLSSSRGSWRMPCGWPALPAVGRSQVMKGRRALHRDQVVTRDA